jgi:hypothetical protein
MQMMQELPPLKDKTIVRRLFKFFRHHRIEFEPLDGHFLLGSATCTVTNGNLNAYFPQIAKHYGNHIYFRDPFDDCYNTYIRFSRKHNQLAKAFPAAITKTVPDLFD